MGDKIQFFGASEICARVELGALFFFLGARMHIMFFHFSWASGQHAEFRWFSSNSANSVSDGVDRGVLRSSY